MTFRPGMDVEYQGIDGLWYPCKLIRRTLNDVWMVYAPLRVAAGRSANMPCREDGLRHLSALHALAEEAE